MAKNSRALRNARTNPYLETDRFFTTINNSAAGSLWRWRTELLLIVATVGGVWWLANTVGPWPPIIAIIGIAVILGAIPVTRRWIVAHMWCLISRHRLQRLFCEAPRLHTKGGRLPLILWIRPTTVGERAWLWLRAGICFEDFEAHTGEIRSGCYARDARVAHHPRWSHMITVDIVRRDTLGTATNVIPLVTKRHPRPTSRDGS